MSYVPEQPRPAPDKPNTPGMLERLAAEVGPDHIVADAGRPKGTPVTDAAVARYEKRDAREAFPEWTKEEVERLADAHVLFSEYRLNPSFWGYLHSVGWETPVYKAIDAVIANPHLFHYRVLGPNKTEVIPRASGMPDVEGTEALVVEGGLQNGSITEIRIAGKTLKLNPKAYRPWLKYLDDIRTLSQADTAASYNLEFPRETVDYKQLQTEFVHQGPRLLKALLEARARGRLGAIETGAGSLPTADAAQVLTDMITAETHGERYETVAESGGPLLNVLVYVYEKGFNDQVIEITSPITQDDIDNGRLPAPLIGYTPDGLIVMPRLNPDGTPMMTPDGMYVMYQTPGKDGVPTVRQLMIERYQDLVR